MTDIYIATPTQADYDALMRLAEAAGYKWDDSTYPTEENWWECDEEDTVVHLYEDPWDGKRMMRDGQAYYKSQGATIETICDLHEVTAIWHVAKGNRSKFIKEYPDASTGTMIVNESGSVIQYYAGFSFDKSNVVKALAVEYKPKESEEVMNEKVKLPRNIINTFSEELELSKFKGLGAMTPIAIITRIDSTLGGANNEARAWCNNSNNQHKLISAVLYGYEPEPEQLYYVRFTENDKFGYLNIRLEDGSYKADSIRNDSHFKTQFTMPEILAIDPRYKAFAVKVEEVDGNE